MLLRQQETPVIVYADEETRAALGWIDAVLSRFCGIEWRSVTGGLTRLTDGITFRGIKLRQSIAFQFEDELTQRRIVVAPAVGELTSELRDAMADSEVVLCDGTFWSDEELLAIRPSARRATEMHHLPIRSGSLDFLRQCSARRKIYIHINNTNPILIPGSSERRKVEEAAIEVASDGMEIVL